MSGLQVFQPNDVQIFNLTAGKALPKWLTERKRRQLLQRDGDLQKRIELIQDFEFPIAANCIEVSQDDDYIFAAGTYKPSIKCFELSQLSTKFERHVNCEVVDMKLLSSDYTKLALLQADRYIELHAQYGYHFRTRIPTCGRQMAYQQETADLLTVGTGSDVYRLNLSTGSFLQPFTTQSSDLNACSVNPVHGLVLVGGQDGIVYAFDPRARTQVGKLDVSMAMPFSGSVPSITCICSVHDGLTVAVGTNTADILVFDIRSKSAVLTKSHNYGLPIQSILHHKKSDMIISADQKVVKLWHRSSGKNLTTFEATADINDVALDHDSGLVFVAGEQPKIMPYFIPELGRAPKWCSYLDNLSDELEEDANKIVYDDYTFLTKEDLEKLGLDHLIGTHLLKAYMHGYFMDTRLYNKAKDFMDPDAFMEDQRDRIRRKLEEATESRLKLDKYRQKLPKINRKLAKKLIGKAEEEAESKKKSDEGRDLMEDDRFKQMFSNPEFEIDYDSTQYKMLHPVKSSKHFQNSDLLSAIADEDEANQKHAFDQDEDSDLDNTSEDEDDELAKLGLTHETKRSKPEKRKQPAKKRPKRRKPQLVDNPDMFKRKASNVKFNDLIKKKKAS